MRLSVVISVTYVEIAFTAMVVIHVVRIAIISDIVGLFMGREKMTDVGLLRSVHDLTLSKISPLQLYLEAYNMGYMPDHYYEHIIDYARKVSKRLLVEYSSVGIIIDGTAHMEQYRHELAIAQVAALVLMYRGQHHITATVGGRKHRGLIQPKDEETIEMSAPGAMVETLAQMFLRPEIQIVYVLSMTTDFTSMRLIADLRNVPFTRPVRHFAIDNCPNAAPRTIMNLVDQAPFWTKAFVEQGR